MSARRRVLLKISGESLADDGGQGISKAALGRLCAELAESARLGVEIALVVGGGNFVRGRALAGASLPRHLADQMGMLATVLNGLAVGAELRARGVAARLLSALEVRGLVEPYSVERGLELLEQNAIVVLGGGTGNPYFSTDTCASLRGVELGAELLLKGTKVDGIYSQDPQKHPGAELYQRLGYRQVLEQQLEVMDSTAIAMCREHGLPVRVFNMMRAGNIRRALLGEAVGTLVSPDADPAG